MLSWRHLADRVTSRRGAWITLLVALAVTMGLMGALRGATVERGDSSLPSSSEAAQVARLQQEFPGHERTPVVVVMSREDEAPLTQADLGVAQKVGAAAAAAVGQEPGRPIPSEDTKAVMVTVPVLSDRENTEIATDVDAMRSAIADTDRALPGGGELRGQVTGGPAFGADVASSFKGANFRLLAVTIGIVALLLLLTYRSPVLWLVPLAVVATADGLAGTLTKALGSALDLSFDSGIVSVLVFGAGTNYALLLISRYREELHRHEDHRAALHRALVTTGPAVLASNATVVLALLTLLLAIMPGTRGLGPTSALGLLVAGVFALTVLPAALAVCGRRIFWPFVPRPEEAAIHPVETDAAGATGAHRATPRGSQTQGVWGRIASWVVARPVPVLVAGLVVAAVMASGLIGTRVGLAQTEQFRVASESQQGLEVLARHYPAGESAPLTIMVPPGQVQQATAAAKGTDGISRVMPTGKTADHARLMAVATAEPGSADAQTTVRALREAVHPLGGVVGGQTAQQVDAQDAAARDLKVVAPLILGLVLVVLVLLLRAAVGPVVLLLVNVVSALAAIGAGTWVGEHLFGFPALDVNVPLLAFLFLVALGIDYTIFLAHRTLHEAQEHGTREGVVRAVAHTGGVITSAGIVLAAVFAALGVLPLVTLGQLGLIVGLGVLVDTLLVRTLVVPAIFAVLGDRLWWPRRLASTR